MSRLLDCYNTLPHGGGAHGGQNVGDQQGEAPPAPVVRVRFLPLYRMGRKSTSTSPGCLAAIGAQKKGKNDTFD